MRVTHNELFINERNMLMITGAVLASGTIWLGEALFGLTTTTFFAKAIFVVSAIGVLFVGTKNLANAITAARFVPGEEKAVWQAFASVLCFGLLFGAFGTPFSGYGQHISILQWIGRDLALCLLSFSLGVTVVSIALDSALKLSSQQ